VPVNFNGKQHIVLLQHLDVSKDDTNPNKIRKCFSNKSFGIDYRTIINADPQDSTVGVMTLYNSEIYKKHLVIEAHSSKRILAVKLQGINDQNSIIIINIYGPHLPTEKQSFLQELQRIIKKSYSPFENTWTLDFLC
jgi:hypothetical protein